MCILEAVASLELGGIERLVTSMAPKLASDHGYPTAVVCLMSTGGSLRRELEERDVPVLDAVRTSSIPLAWINKLERLFMQWKPDVYHTHHPFGLPWQVIAAKRAGVKRIVVTEHNTSPVGTAARLRGLVYDRLAWRHIDAYTCVSEAVRRHMAGLRRRSPDQYRIVYNRVDERRFRPDESARETARSAWNIDPETFLIGSVGSLTRQKGYEFLIDAATTVCNHIEDVQIRICGEGPGRADLQRRIDDAQLTSTIILNGNVDNIEAYLPAYDMFVLPSLWEGMSLAVMEAMAVQLPIVATTVSGTMELLADGRGVLVPPGDAEALANAIVRVRRDRQLRMDMAEQARRRVIESYSLEETVAEYLGIFNDSSVGKT